MSNYDASMRRAQAEYDNRTPPDDGPSECPDCDGTGQTRRPDDIAGDCPTCKGFGLIDEDGEPFNPNAKAEAEYERGDYLRQLQKDDALASCRGGVDPEDI